MTWHTIVYHSATLNEHILLLHCVLNWDGKEWCVWSTAHKLAHVGNTFPCSRRAASCCYNRWVWSRETEPNQITTLNTAGILTYIFMSTDDTLKTILQMVSPSLSRAGTPKGKPATIPPGLPSTDACFFLLEVKWEGDWRDLLFVPCSMIRCEHLEQNDWYELQTKLSTSAVHFHYINKTLPMWTYHLFSCS